MTPEETKLVFTETTPKPSELFVKIGGSRCLLSENPHIRDGFMAKLHSWLWPCHIRVMRDGVEEFLREDVFDVAGVNAYLRTVPAREFPEKS